MRLVKMTQDKEELIGKLKEEIDLLNRVSTFYVMCYLKTRRASKFPTFSYCSQLHSFFGEIGKKLGIFVLCVLCPLAENLNSFFFLCLFIRRGCATNPGRFIENCILECLYIQGL